MKNYDYLKNINPANWVFKIWVLAGKNEKSLSKFIWLYKVWMYSKIHTFKFHRYVNRRMMFFLEHHMTNKNHSRDLRNFLELVFEDYSYFEYLKFSHNQIEYVLSKFEKIGLFNFGVNPVDERDSLWVFGFPSICLPEKIHLELSNKIKYYISNYHASKKEIKEFTSNNHNKIQILFTGNMKSINEINSINLKEFRDSFSRITRKC